MKLRLETPAQADKELGDAMHAATMQAFRSFNAGIEQQLTCIAYEYGYPKHLTLKEAAEVMERDGWVVVHDYTHAGQLRGWLEKRFAP